MHLFPTCRPALQEHKSRSLFWKKALLVGLGTFLVTAAALNAQTHKADKRNERPDSNITQMSEKGTQTSQLNGAKFCELAQLCQGRVVYFGDIHINVALRRELMAQLPELKKAGFTHLAVEMEQKDLADFDYAKAMQEAKKTELALNLIEKFGIENLGPLTKRIQNKLNQPDADTSKAAGLKGAMEFLNDQENIQTLRKLIPVLRELNEVSQAQFELMDSARRLGFTLVATDSLGNIDDKLNKARSKTSDLDSANPFKMKLKELLEGELSSYMDAYGSYTDDLMPRNRHMSRQISEVLANQNNRVLVFIGAGHLVKSGIPALVSKMSGESGPTILFSYHGALKELYYRNSPIDKSVQSEASARKWNSKRFALPADAIGVKEQCDWYFHLPEKTK